MKNSTSYCFHGYDTANYMSFVGMLVGCGVLFVCITIITTICRTPALHNNTNLCIISITVTDMFTAISTIVSSSFYFTSLNQYVDNKYLLDVFYFAMSFSWMFSSGIHLLIIAIDRYLYILKPFYYMKYITKARIIKILFSLWMFTFLFLITPFIFFRSSHFQNICILTHPPVEYASVGVGTDFVSFIVVCVLYFRIANVAFRRKKLKNVRRLQGDTPHGVIISRNNGKAALKSLKFFVAMFGTYVFSCIPPLTVTLLSMLSVTLPLYIAISSYFFFYAHIIMNIIIYLNMNKDFRLGVKNLFSEGFDACCRMR